MGSIKKPINEKILANWLKVEFKNNNTKYTYLAALRLFKKVLGIEYLSDYLKGNPNVILDLRTFLIHLDNKPSKTINTYVGAVKVFLRDHDAEASEKDWRKLKKRGFMPKRVKAETQDKKPSKLELKRILNHLNIKGRSLVLFLTSSGARIGETLQLKVEDFNLDADPPKATIRSAYTKGGVGGRTVYFSYEARDTIKDWFAIKSKTNRRSGGTFDGDLMFPWNSCNARFMWNTACDKAGLGMKDPRTNRRIYHFHSLRKFFRTNIGLDLDFVHALMGHTEYLDESYLRLDEQGEIAQAYLSAMKNVSVYSATLPRKEEVKRALAMQGLTFDDVLKVLGKEMYDLGEGSGGGYGLKVPLDEDYIASLEDQEIGKYALKALREKLLGTPNQKEPSQKVIGENELESFLADGWCYVNSLNNGSGKCIVTKS